MDNQKSNKISVSPNPFASVAKIDMEFSASKMVSIDIVTVDGDVRKNLYRGNVEADFQYHYELDGSTMSSGQYLLKVSDGTEVDALPINLIRDMHYE
jgi:hypothetical protein